MKLRLVKAWFSRGKEGGTNCERVEEEIHGMQGLACYKNEVLQYYQVSVKGEDPVWGVLGDWEGS